MPSQTWCVPVRLLLLYLLLIGSSSTATAQTLQTDKIHLTISQRLQAGENPEVIIVLDDAAAFAELQAGDGPDDNRPGLKGPAFRKYKSRIASLHSLLQFEVQDQNASITRAFANIPLAVVRIGDRTALETLSRSPVIEGIYANRSLYPLLQQSLPMINQPLVLDAGAGGGGTAIAIIDSGVDYSSSYFGCSGPGIPEDCKLIHSEDFTNSGDESPGSHGTRVAAIASRVAPDAGIISLRVIEERDSKDSYIVAALDWAIEHQAEYNITAVNLSLGTGEHFTAQCTESLYTSVFARLRTAGVVPVVASGNEAFKDGLTEPACVPGAVSVGAVYDAPQGNMGYAGCTDDAPAKGDVICFSNSADFLTLLAPGGVISITNPSPSVGDLGTSLAAPFISGAVAALRGADGNPFNDIAQTIRHMVESGKPIRDPGNGLTHPLIDLEAALLHDRPVPLPEIHSITPAAGTAGTPVSITGRNFFSVSSVEFGGVPASEFTVVSSRTIDAVVGDGSSSLVRVENPAGIAEYDGFIYLHEPLASISNTPATAELNTMDDLLQISVTGHFPDDTTVDLGTSVSFSSQDEKIATVDENGGIRPVREGEVEIHSHFNGLTGITMIKVDLSTSRVFETESNDTLTSANNLTGNDRLYTGRIGTYGDIDFYKITLTQPAVLTLLIRTREPAMYAKPMSASIIDENGKVFASARYRTDEEDFINLSAFLWNEGTYFIEFRDAADGAMLPDDFPIDDYEFIYQLNPNLTAAQDREREPNDSVADASLFTAGSTIQGQLSRNGDQDYFAFDLSPGVFQVSLTSNDFYQVFGEMVIKDAAGNLLAAKDMSYWSDEPLMLTLAIPVAGRYYVFLHTMYDHYYDSFSADYELETQFSDDKGYFGGYWESEPNNETATAPLYLPGTSISGQLSSVQDIDYFAFNLGAGVLTVDTGYKDSGLDTTNSLAIMDTDGNILASKFISPDIDYPQTLAVRIDHDGTYYAMVQGNMNYDYEFRPALVDDAELFQALEREPNETFAQAELRELDKRIAGQLYGDTDQDYFSLELPAGILRVETLMHSETFGDNRFSILDAAGNVLVAEEIRSGETDLLEARVSSPGRIYLNVSGYTHENYEMLPAYSDDPLLFNSLESEPNDTIDKALDYSADSELVGELSSVSDIDYYAVYLAPGVLTIKPQPVVNGSGTNRISVIDYSGALLSAKLVDYGIRGPLTDPYLTARIDTEGRYYIGMEAGTNYHYSYAFHQGRYALTLEMTDDPYLFAAHESEPNDSIQKPQFYSSGQDIIGHLHDGTDKDFFALDLKTGMFTVQAKPRILDDNWRDNYIKILDAAGNVLAQGQINGSSATQLTLSVSIETPGRYYILVESRNIYNYINQNYEIVTLLDPDTDGDGLLDHADPDDDNDGMTDEAETAAGRNPSVNENQVLQIILLQEED